jgi:hypothetical protein
MLGWERPHKTPEPIATREWRCLRQNVVKYSVRPPVSCDQLLVGSEAETARPHFLHVLHWATEQVPSLQLSWGDLGIHRRIKGKVKLALCLIMLRATEVYVGFAVLLHAFLTSTLDGGEWTCSRHGRFTPVMHFTEGWIDPTAGMGATKTRKINDSCQGSDPDSSVVQPVA